MIIIIKLTPVILNLFQDPLHKIPKQVRNDGILDYNVTTFM